MLNTYAASGKIHNFYLWGHRGDHFEALTFFKTDAECQKAKLSGLTQEIEGFIRKAIEDVGRGKADELNITFEWDSDENVTRHYEGDYFLRLRG